MTQKTIQGILASAKAAPNFKGEARAVIVTPEMAEELLKANDNIRHVAKAVVTRYSLDMMLDRWKLTGETIIFGLERPIEKRSAPPEACIQSGVPFITFIVIGVDP